MQFKVSEVHAMREIRTGKGAPWGSHKVPGTSPVHSSFSHPGCPQLDVPSNKDIHTWRPISSFAVLSGDGFKNLPFPGLAAF